MKNRTTIMSLTILASVALSASATTFYEEDFDPSPATSGINGSNGKVWFAGQGNAGDTPTPTISSNVYAMHSASTITNNLLKIDSLGGKVQGAGVVVDPSALGGVATNMAVTFDLVSYSRDGGVVGSANGSVKVYKAFDYDLTGATDAKIVLDLANNAGTSLSAFGVNGTATAALIDAVTLDENTALGELSINFAYDGTSALVVIFESNNKPVYEVDNIKIATAIPALEGASDVVFFGGDSGIFTGDATINNQFVSQTGSGQILQWNGVGDGSGQLSNMGIGGALTNSVNDLVLTTVGISPAGSNTFAFGTPNILGITGGDNGKFNTDLGEAWTFEFNKDVLLNQLVLTALDFDGETVRVTVDGVDTNTFTRLDANMTNLAWEATANKYIYTYTEPVLIPAGTDITIDGTSGAWALQGLVVDVPSLIETLPLINFGGNPDLKTNATYMAELGGDAIVAWWGGDDDGGFITNGIGTLKDQGVGATLTSVKYDVTVETLAIDSTLPEGTNTVVSGGSLGITGGDNAKLDSENGEAWTLDFDTDVYLYKVGLKGFTGGLEVADIIIGGVTNTIVPTDCVAAVSETGLNIYTFVDPILIPAGTVVQIDAPGGQWGVGNLVVGVVEKYDTPESLYADWLSDYPALGSDTNLFDNPDNDSLDNLSEYALGGDPTQADGSVMPSYSASQEGGTNYFDYVYMKHADAEARGLSYEVQLDDNLVFAPGWTNIGYEVINGAISDGFQSVTNRVTTDGEPQQFFNLIIEYN
jgi:hypothetical protein